MRQKRKSPTIVRHNKTVRERPVAFLMQDKDVKRQFLGNMAYVTSPAEWKCCVLHLLFL
ncbi:hypothetical protein CEXT_650401, partial [Caerostris extrusa]